MYCRVWHTSQVDQTCTAILLSTWVCNCQQSNAYYMVLLLTVLQSEHENHLSRAKKFWWYIFANDWKCTRFVNLKTVEKLMHGIQLCFRGWLYMAQDRAVQPRVVVLVWSTVLKGLNPTEGPACTVIPLPYSFKFTKYARVKYILTSCLCICLNTLTGRCTPRPISCSLTSASTVSHQVVARVTNVGGCLS